MVRWILGIGLSIAALTAIAFFWLDVGHECGRHQRFTTIRPTRGFCRSPLLPARDCLKYIASAQQQFRSLKAQGGGDPTFWRSDVAGLYAYAPKGGPAVKLLYLMIASADDRPVVDLSPYSVKCQYAGYWYRAIRHADEDPEALDPARFAACAYPDSPSAGKYLYVVDECLTLYRTVANGRRGIDVFPTEEELRTSWAKCD